MYEAYFGFNSRPFSATPCADQYFPAAVIEAARQSLERSVRQATGLGLAVGASGVGKSMLAAVLAKQLSDSFAVVLLSCGRLDTRRALLQAILHGLGQPYRGMDEGELRLAMIDHLRGDDRRGLVILVDEAHSMPMRLLEELRLITNLAVQGRSLVRLVLLGSAALEERLATARMESFNQRLVARCYLEPFNQTETGEYILAQISAAGSGDSLQSVISPEGRKAVFEATDGIPRLINQICDHALLWACCKGRPQVDAGIVEEAWADLQQLPTPWNDEANDNRAGGGSPAVIEFGGLDDEEEDEAPDSPCSSDSLDEGDTLPSLRLTQASDGLPVDSEERLERVQDTAENLDDEFHPAGSIGPEVELVFDDPADLLNETFEEEEQIVDRYGRETRPATQAARLESASPQSQPSAPPSETRRPAPLSPTEMTNVETAAEFPPEAVSVEVALIEGSSRRELPVQRPAEAEPSVEKHPAIEETPPGQPANTQTRTVPLGAIRAGEIGAATDPGQELVVIEDVLATTGHDPSSPASAVPHQEFDQFFARLRRTS